MADDHASLAWGHINVNVSQLERSVEFYAMLGFTPFMQAIPYLGITADTVSEIAAAGAHAGVQFLTPPQTMAGELAEVAVCTDPDGTLIELIQVHLHKWASLASD